MLRVIKYLIVFIAFLLLLLFGASIVITKFYSDQLKELALIKLNEHLETPIYVNQISDEQIFLSDENSNFSKCIFPIPHDFFKA